MFSFSNQICVTVAEAPAVQFSDSWVGTLLSGAVGAVIGAAAAVISAVLVVRRSYKDQRRIATEGRARRAAVDFLTKLRGITEIKSEQEAAAFRNELDAAATLWAIEEEEVHDNVRALTQAILRVFSEAWLLDAKGIESLVVRAEPASDASLLVISAHTAVLELLEGRGEDAVHHFLVSFGMAPDGRQITD